MTTKTHQLETARPVFRRGMPPRPQRGNFATEALMRLALLAGQRCSNCDHRLSFDGSRLRCEECGYDYSNPDAAESEVYFGMCLPSRS